MATLDPVGPKFGGRIITTLDPVGPKFGVVREWNFCTSGAEVKAFRNKRKNGDILICLQWRQIFQTSASIRNKRKKDLTPSPFCAIILVEGAYR